MKELYTLDTIGHNANIGKVLWKLFLDYIPIDLKKIESSDY